MGNIVKKLLSDRVLILPDPAETKTKSGIIIPKDAQEAPTKGTVVQVGIGKKSYTMSLKEGDRVLYPNMAGFDTEIKGTVYKQIRETDVMALITENTK